MRFLCLMNLRKKKKKTIMIFFKCDKELASGYQQSQTIIAAKSLL